ncbi:hypothetical protein M988_2291 [Hafnia paralvei ATCC 29927]|uniref:hypothetical protein n=1 Tax=Hafnia paralvei TaxID=546367 RepID=UPI0007E416F1|nr:hypothetical protein [Hafnia paralvei]OAT41114.1 hypothetical protein M988_2291 [Hafnia paralvei ATCC 29927]
MKSNVLLSNVERLKLLKTIRLGLKSDNDLDKYIEMFWDDEVSECKRRLNGYYLEDEFALMCFLMECCISLVSLGQSSVNNIELKVPDYLACFTLPKGKELKCFIEVKTSQSIETKKISNNFLNKYSEYAARFNYPLFLASRIQAGNMLFWVLQSENEFRGSGRKVKVNELVNNSGSILIDDFFISIINDIHIRIKFIDEDKYSGIKYEGKGYVSEVTIFWDGDRTNSLSLNDNLGLNIILDEFSSEEEYIERERVLIRKISKNTMEMLSTLLLKINRRIVNDDSPDDRLNASRILARIEAGDTVFIKRSPLLNMIHALNVKSFELNGKALLLPALLGDKISRKRKLKELLKIS